MVQWEMGGWGGERCHKGKVAAGVHGSQSRAGPPSCVPATQCWAHSEAYTVQPPRKTCLIHQYKRTAALPSTPNYIRFVFPLDPKVLRVALSSKLTPKKRPPVNSLNILSTLILNSPNGHKPPSSSPPS